MRRAGLTGLVWLALASACWGQTVTLPAEVKTEPGLFAVIRSTTDCGALQWLALDPGLALLPPELLKDSRVAVVQAVKAGKYRLLAYGAKGDVASPPAICTVVVGTPPDPGPGPNPPVPPDPPDPVPPAPIAGKRVLIVYETADISKMPAAQQEILFGRQVRDYLDQHTDLDKDGKTHAWRIYDKDVDTSGESGDWQAAMKRKRDSVPWLIVSNGTTGWEGPLPANSGDFLLKVKAYLGE